MGTLYIVATPIGNLKDITLRALEVLKLVKVVFAEDTRVTRKLCVHYGITARVERCDAHATSGTLRHIRELLVDGASVAFVTDAGTPAISDPGSRLVSFLRIELPEVSIVPIPGPSAITTALSAAGISADQFTFLGYPPHRKGRQKFFDELLFIRTKPLILYESPHRIQKTLGDLGRVFGSETRIIVARELTKMHEEIWGGTLVDAGTTFVGERGRGEFVIIIS